MKEIRFRAYHKEKGIMVQPNDDGFYISFDGMLCMHQPSKNGLEIAVLNPSHFNVMQYTGLKDGTKWEQLTVAEQKAWVDRGETQETWNGVEIYEGDIVRMAGKVRQPRWGIVWYENGWQMRLIQSKPEHPKNYYVKLSSDKVIEFDEVIGNIYENPELSKEVNNG